jgi:hypothetical protein
MSLVRQLERPMLCVSIFGGIHAVLAIVELENVTASVADTCRQTG